jgi:formamidopyrimidine-DNA glycosylase
MPELPEVETIKRILNSFLPGKEIESVLILREKSILSDPDEFRRLLPGRRFLPVTREGKFLLFHLTGGLVILSHLRMEGKYFECPADFKPEKHDILIYRFTDGTGLRFNDVRKFGIIELFKEEDVHKEKPLSELGKEPFDLTPEELLKGLRRKRTEPIKEALLDQTLISGLGNIYDDEVLFASGVNPKREASSITKEEAALIIKNSRRILSEAIENGGSTIKSYHPKEGVSGNMQNRLLAYGHANEPCVRCGFPMRKIRIGGRGTTYCPHCQPLKGRPFVVGVTGPIASGKSTVSAYLKNKGYTLLDADGITASLYKESPELREKVKAIFGPDAVTGSDINRPYILSEIAKDPAKKKQLEAEVLPEVYLKMRLALEQMDGGKAVLDVPLLIGSPLEEECDLIISVFADEKIQKARIKARGKDPELSMALNKGWPKGAAKKASGLVLDGNGSPEDLKKQLDAISYL